MTEDLSAESRATSREKAEAEKNVISTLGIDHVFEGIGNIINIVGKIVEEGGISQGKEADEKTPVCSHNTQ